MSGYFKHMLTYFVGFPSDIT